MKRIGIFFAIVPVLLVALPVAFFATADHNDFQNPMLNAARDGDFTAITKLLTNGTGVNTSDAFNNTPLSIAAHFGQTEAAELLIKNGAKIDGIDGEMTPLQCAVYSGHPVTAAFLLRHGAEPNRAGESGNTALAIAASNGNASMVKTLFVRRQKGARRFAPVRKPGAMFLTDVPRVATLGNAQQ